MNPAFIAFSDKGEELANRLAADLGGSVSRGGRTCSLSEWTAETFSSADALVFVGAAGIAVRAIAPFVKSKASDPAVVAVDELGTYAIPLLSGHLGGANELARRIAAVCGAEAVITTATDRNGVFAVDEWARVQGFALPCPEKIKNVSAALLAGNPVRIRSDWAVAGDPPAGVAPVEQDPCDVWLTLKNDATGALPLIPRILVLGIGCRKGITADALEGFFASFLEQNHLREEGISRVCSIDLKAQEEGLLAFCRRHGFAFQTFPAEELAALPGSFTASAYVREITGVDNVCERSAVLGSGGTLLIPKTAGGGITMALAMMPFAPDWRWQYA